ncbi:MAG: peptidylprolyl isomerase [candidate division Zixibacteria bacterium]|nr:peptidylprolyl isomerase [candidate division Zixibacteria bacterium]
MKRLLIAMFAIVALMGCSQAETGKGKESKVETKRPRVIMETDMGKIVLELFPDVAPNHAKNFLDLANKGFYDGLAFHRVIQGFVIQGGDPNGDGTGGSGKNVNAEFSNLKHMPGTLSMARANDPNSASSQFYICLAQLPSLDGKYSIFGQTVEGMDVVTKIGAVKTGPGDKPVTPVRMIRVYEEGKERPAKTGGTE